MESTSKKLSKLNTIILDGIETGVLLKDFAQHLKRKDVARPDIDFTLLDEVSNTPDFVINSHAKAKKKKKLDNISESERQKLHRFYTQGFADYGLRRNWQKQLNSLQ